MSSPHPPPPSGAAAISRDDCGARSDGMRSQRPKYLVDAMSSPHPPPPSAKKKELKKSLVDHIYRDYSRTNVRSLIPDLSGPNEELFPSKLHRMLSSPEYARIIAWKRHGRAWHVIDRHRLVTEVLPRHFEHGNFESFNRSVNGWGFKRLRRKGPDQNAYYHELFLRGLPELTSLITRRMSPGKRLPDKAKEPDFYLISARYPLPGGAPASPRHSPPAMPPDVHRPHQEHLRHPHQPQPQPPQMPYVPQSPHHGYPPHIPYYQPPPQFYPPPYQPYPPHPGYPPYQPPSGNAYPPQSSYPPQYSQHQSHTQHHSPTVPPPPPPPAMPHSPYYPPPQWESHKAPHDVPPQERHPPRPQYHPHSPAAGFTPVIHRYDSQDHEATDEVDRTRQRYIIQEGTPPARDERTLGGTTTPKRDRDEPTADEDEPPAKRLNRAGPRSRSFEAWPERATLPDPVEDRTPREGEEDELIDPLDADDCFDPAPPTVRRDEGRDAAHLSKGDEEEGYL